MDLSRWISLAVAIIYVAVFVLALAAGGEDEERTTPDIVKALFGLVMWLTISLGCIWIGDELGEGMTGAKYGLISRPSPGWAVKLMGWVLLFLPVVIIIILLCIE